MALQFAAVINNRRDMFNLLLLGARVEYNSGMTNDLKLCHMLATFLLDNNSDESQDTAYNISKIKVIKWIRFDVKPFQGSHSDAFRVLTDMFLFKREMTEDSITRQQYFLKDEYQPPTSPDWIKDHKAGIPLTTVAWIDDHKEEIPLAPLIDGRKDNERKWIDLKNH